MISCATYAAHCDVTLVGSTKLAGLAEAFMKGEAGRRTPRSPPKSRPALWKKAAFEPIVSCSPARIIRCC